MVKITKIVKWLRLDKINTHFHRPTRIPGNSVEFTRIQWKRYLTTLGKLEGKSVYWIIDTDARVSATKEKVPREIYGDVPFFAVQTWKSQPTTKKNYEYTAFIP